MASCGGAGQGLPEARRSIGPADGIIVPSQCKGALVPLEPALLWKVSWPGFRGVVRLLNWFEVPEGFALLMERLEHRQHLWYFLHERQFLTEPMVWGLLCQVLEAVRRCSSQGVLCHHIKAENVLVDLATGEVKPIDFECGTILQDTFYTPMSATIWSLSILLHELVCGHLPFHTNEDIVQGQLFFPPWMSQGALPGPGDSRDASLCTVGSRSQQVAPARVSWHWKKTPERFPAAVAWRRGRSRGDASAGPHELWRERIHAARPIGEVVAVR
ncbi:serine/threonine-protein kinase pim-1-like [Melozone crissalis]|uniref:serine/threonine-protein kinase pim-1-like n=1 Tax=Melozone crissalis TaxID=40204 RepID=UPI0023DC905C|nr:serine/threonine-protein kinase pim-1-like [Melozone crissalis]